MKTLITSFLFLLAIAIGEMGEASAEPTSSRVLISYVRPYFQTSTVVVGVSSPVICNTDTFFIDTSQIGGKEGYAAALTSLATKKSVALEVSNSRGCTGWGTLLQSIYSFSE